MVSQMSLLKGAIPRAGQTFHQRLILAFILFLNYFPARLSPLQLWAGIFFCKLFFFCWLFCTFLASVVCSQRHGLGSALGMPQFGFCSGNARLGAAAGPGAGDARGSVSSCCCRSRVCQASAFSGFLSPFSSVLLQRRQDSLGAECAVAAAWCSLGTSLSPPGSAVPSQGC